MDANTLSTIAPLFFIMAIMYFLLIRPQQQQAKKLREKIGGARRGDTVVTSGGIVGTMVKTPDAQDQEVTVEIADNVQVKVMKHALTDVRPKGGETANKG